VLGLVGLVQFAPRSYSCSTPVADRYNRRAVMGICIGVEAICTQHCSLAGRCMAPGAQATIPSSGLCS
jgi:hypothetical protein